LELFRWLRRLAGTKEEEAVKRLSEFVVKALVNGVLLALPPYIALLLLLRAAKSVARLVHPIAALLPQWWLFEDTAFACLIVLVVCFMIGAAVTTRPGRWALGQIDRSVLARIPGYVFVRSLTAQLTGDGHEKAWKPALAEIENGLVPAFIVEEVDDRRFTVFVPSVPAPLDGSIYVLREDRVHPLHTSFAQVLKTLSRCGSGSRNLVAAMEAPKESQPQRRVESAEPRGGHPGPRRVDPWPD
jgi:uncharacterized membrane protein